MDPPTDLPACQPGRDTGLSACACLPVCVLYCIVLYCIVLYVCLTVSANIAFARATPLVSLGIFVDNSRRPSSFRFTTTYITFDDQGLKCDETFY